MKRVNNIFTSSIDGMNAYKKYGEIGRLDRKVTSLKERTDNIEELLDEDDFFEEYFEHHYDPIIGQDSALSEENNISQMLSSMADYLLNSDESKEIDKKEKIHYVFTEDETKKREKYRNSKNSFESTDDKNIEIVSKPVKPVEFKSQEIVINKKDLHNNNEMSRILSEYSHLIGLINSASEKDFTHKRKYNSMIGLVKDDMKMVKESYLGIFPRSKSVPGGHYIKPVPSPDYHMVNVFKKMYNTFPTSVEENYEMWENSFDFSVIIQNADLSQTEKDIITLKRYGWTFDEIVEDLGLEKYYNTNDISSYVKKHAVDNIYKKVLTYVENRDYDVFKNQKITEVEEL